MKIDAIHRGIVLDHIKAGRAMDIYRYLHLDELQCPVAIIKNARSEAMGLKDIIKIDDEIDSLIIGLCISRCTASVLNL